MDIQELIMQNSMQTQTSFQPNPRNKKLPNEPYVVKITAILEINDHDGWCSGEECEYTRKTVKTVIPVPEKYKNQPLGEIVVEKGNATEWTKYLKLPNINLHGSGYCRCHIPKGGVGKHQYRYTIKNVVIIENNKYKNKNGYLVLAAEGSYSDYEKEPYGYSKTLEDARTMAIEAVMVGSKRDKKWNRNDEGGSFDYASVVNLDNMQKCKSISKYHKGYRVEPYHES